MTNGAGVEMAAIWGVVWIEEMGVVDTGADLVYCYARG